MTVRDHLADIYKRYGYLTPELVVEEARSVGTVLHGAVFKDSIPEAAEKWYRHRAHELIQSFKLAYKSAPDSEPKTIREWHSLRSDESGTPVFRHFNDIAPDPVASQILLRDAERDWRQLRSRYGHLREFVEMVQREVNTEAALAA